MKPHPRFPLLAKVLCWLVLHLVILGLAFFLFVRWQLGLGLDSLLSGAAGDRLTSFGDSVIMQISDLPRHRWNEEIESLADEKGVTAALLLRSDNSPFPTPVPPNVLERARSVIPPQPTVPGPPPSGGRGFQGPGLESHEGRPPGRERVGDGRPPPPSGSPDRKNGPRPPGMPPGANGPEEFSKIPPKTRPAFLMRGDNGDGYWAGVLLHLKSGRDRGRRVHVLLVRADHLDGSGMFFDFKPWLRGGLAVLFLSLAFWTPFVWGMTRYLRRLTMAADQIATGRFQVSLPRHGNDELGNLGRTIESMAARLDHLVTGQKRFLGDAAHELCAPLARIRTGLGILENQPTAIDPAAISSIEADAEELAGLVNELLAFSRTGNRKPSLQSVVVEELISEVIAREAVEAEYDIEIPKGLTVQTDPALLGRAIGNLIRNAGIHASPRPKVCIRAVEALDAVSITVADNGPGVPAAEVSRLFEPFYRIDRSRSRDSGGSGLGLAIVRSAIETCGGEATASLPDHGGFAVTLRLPKKMALSE